MNGRGYPPASSKKRMNDPRRGSLDAGLGNGRKHRNLGYSNAEVILSREWGGAGNGPGPSEHIPIRVGIIPIKADQGPEDFLQFPS